METPDSSSRPWAFVFRWPAIVIGTVAAVGLLALIAVSPLPMRGAEVFGALVNKIKGNPGATAFWVFIGLGLLWAAIAMLTGIQEWRAARQRQ